jgi:hypothetical protein
VNIFLLDYNARTAAQYHNDVHLRKMILETFQIIHTARYNQGWACIHKWIQRQHAHHPAVLWAQTNLNSSFLFYLLYHLMEEYEYRFEKKHACLTDLFHTVEMVVKYDALPHNFVRCMPDKYKIFDSPVLCYRNYYIHEKRADKTGRPMDVWTKRGPPYWWLKELNERQKNVKCCGLTP